jgi:DNA-binding cell septation regulator SpoVG
MVVIIEWIVGIIIGFWLLGVVVEVGIALIGGLYSMFSERRYRRMRRKAFEDVSDPINEDFKFKYLFPRKK